MTKPDITLTQTRDVDKFKLYVSDIGLFTTMLFNDNSGALSDIYKKLLSDKLDADLGYMYENAVAQMLVSSGRELYYHTWKKEDSTHLYEVDFLITNKKKVIPIEVKSSNVKNRKSIEQFAIKYSKYVGEQYLFSQKDVSSDKMLKLRPIYMCPFVMENLN